MGTAPKRNADDWGLVFRPVGNGPPAAIRVRKVLKFAKKVLGLRCVGYTQPDPGPARAQERS